MLTGRLLRVLRECENVGEKKVLTSAVSKGNAPLFIFSCCIFFLFFGGGGYRSCLQFMFKILLIHFFSVHFHGHY